MQVHKIPLITFTLFLLLQSNILTAIIHLHSELKEEWNYFYIAIFFWSALHISALQYSTKIKKKKKVFE